MKAAADAICKNEKVIISKWENLVVKEIFASNRTEKLVLHDHLPQILKDIATIFYRQNPAEKLKADDTFQEILGNSRNHGKHRATSEFYTVKQVVHEYIIFHRVITAELEHVGVYNLKTADTLKYIIETAILESVGSFSASIQEMQEKLVGTVAHDIRNPLSAAQLSIEMLKKDSEPEWFNRMKKAAERSVKKSLNLIEGLLDGISVKAGQGIMMDFTQADINKSIRYVHEEAAHIYSQIILLKAPEHEIMGVFDETAIRRMLENLISNAVKYGTYNEEIILELKDSEDEIEVSVLNQGEAISTEKQKSIFEFLSSSGDANNGYRSWGMGLVLVKMVAEAHDGGVSLESSAEKGTRFIVRLKKNHNTPGRRRTKLNYVLLDEKAPLD